MTRLNHLALNKCHLNFSTAGTALIPKKKRSGIPSAIRDSMVLWYDVKHQGCSNESMAANPVLRDLSGNGHDATCYNFAWSGMSGVGGYGLSFSQYNNIRQDRAVIEFEGDYITIIKSVVLASWQLYNKVSNQLTVSAQRIKVSNVPQNASITYAYRYTNYSTIKLVSITNDGIYDIPSFTVPSGQIYGLEIKPVIDECNITIEQLPLYPYALVSDGVDDYAMVEGLPILTKEKGFTVIAKRKWISDLNVSLALLYKTTDLSFRGAFVLEGITGGGAMKTNYSFGTNNEVEEFESSDITYLTSNSYNGKLIKSGFSEDTDFIEIFRARQLYCSAALYSLLLFDRDFTPEEIEWVKTNLMSE